VRLKRWNRVEPQTANAAQFSNIEARVDNLVALVLSFPDLRSARVKALKAQIDAGTYNVPAEQIAAALFDYLRTRTNLPPTHLTGACVPLLRYNKSLCLS
jgi:flagellar biosynthesis anti-sigma factor FlgM